MSRATRFFASRRYRGYVLALLVAVGVLAWVDRNVFAILLQSIKADLELSDTELGLLGGAAFGLFYATVGLPVAWFADRTNRRSLLAASLAAWSIMTALCGLATSFAALFLTRVGVGIGEAGGTPPSHSLVSDYFPPERRAFAFAVLSLYIPLGFALGYLGGGWLNEALGWRAAFVAVGLPGVIVALVVRVTLREPPRGAAEGVADPGAAPPLLSTLRQFWRRRALRHLPLGGAVHGIGAFAASVWLPAYFMRVHGASSVEAGAWMALAYGVGGGAGLVLGGMCMDRLVERTGDPRWHAWGPAAVMLLTAPVAALVYLAEPIWLAAAALLAATMLGHMFVGPVLAMVQGLAGLRRRAVAAAYYLLLANLVSMGAGPVIVGIVSDLLGATHGAASLRYALLLLVPATCLWAAAHFWLAAGSLRDDLAAARQEEPAAASEPPLAGHRAHA